MSNIHIKVCPYCAEQINAAAKVCPRCRQWLSFFSLRNPAAFMAVLYSCLSVILVGCLFSLQGMLNPGTDFSSYPNGLRIVESRMNLTDRGADSAVHVVGVITNQTDIAWKEIQTDVRFFNKAGVLIDARSGNQYFIILPHADSAFRINVQPCRPLADYDSYKIFVRYARDARAHF
jgi:predicted nucleic acid-binding Zn ribbon protein